MNGPVSCSVSGHGVYHYDVHMRSKTCSGTGGTCGTGGAGVPWQWSR